jgi:hypothetical protein
MERKDGCRLPDTEREDLQKSTGAIDVPRFGDMILDPCRRGPRHDGRQQRHDQIKRQK